MESNADIINIFRQASSKWDLVFWCPNYAVVKPRENNNGFSSCALSNGGQSIRLSILEELVELGIVEVSK